MGIAFSAGRQEAVNSALLLRPDGSSLGQIGCLTVRLAQSQAEIDAAMRLRHQVFFGGEGELSGARDMDRFDAVCDHLIVIDTSISAAPFSQIVGTYRLLREERAAEAGGYYSQCEFDVKALIAKHPSRRFLELGRSCVLPQYRSKRTVELLWQGIWAYCRMHSVDVMFGCASFPGTLPVQHALPLSFLYHHALADADWRVLPADGHGASMDLVPLEAIDMRAALAGMPPLIKGYLRLGARFSGQAAIDREFGSTDVLVIVRTEEISGRYISHFGIDADRFA